MPLSMVGVNIVRSLPDFITKLPDSIHGALDQGQATTTSIA
jgi:hypothetical protein